MSARNRSPRADRSRRDVSRVNPLTRGTIPGRSRSTRTRKGRGRAFARRVRGSRREREPDDEQAFSPGLAAVGAGVGVSGNALGDPLGVRESAASPTACSVAVAPDSERSGAVAGRGDSREPHAARAGPRTVLRQVRRQRPDRPRTLRQPGAADVLHRRRRLQRLPAWQLSDGPVPSRRSVRPDRGDGDDLPAQLPLDRLADRAEPGRPDRRRRSLRPPDPPELDGQRAAAVCSPTPGGPGRSISSIAAASRCRSSAAGSIPPEWTTRCSRTTSATTSDVPQSASPAISRTTSQAYCGVLVVPCSMPMAPS